VKKPKRFTKLKVAAKDLAELRRMKASATESA